MKYPETLLARARRERRERDALVLRDLIVKHGGNVAAIAREMGMSRGGVIARLEKYGLA